jgi:hypothetical protein
LTERPDAGSPSFRRSPFARDVFSDPGRATVPRITAPLMLRSTLWTVSAPATSLFRGSIDTPCNRCVRFVAVVAAGSRNTRYRAARYGLTRPVFHRLDRASLLAPSQSQAENATGNFTKVIQRVPVRIQLADSAAELGRLRPGLSVVVRVDGRANGKASEAQK